MTDLEVLRHSLVQHPLDNLALSALRDERLMSGDQQPVLRYVNTTLNEVPTLRDLFASQPVVAVRLSDRRPLDDVWPDIKVYDWLCRDSVWGRDPCNATCHWLPVELFRRLPRVRSRSPWDPTSGEHWVLYGPPAPRSLPLGELSIACVNYGRHLAGLPELVTPEEVKQLREHFDWLCQFYHD